MNRLYAPITEPVIFFHSKTYEKRSPLLTPYHRHNAYEIYLFLGGNRKMCIEDSSFICQQGDLFIISPEQLHAGMCGKDCEYERIIVNVKQEFLEQLSQNRVNLLKCFKFESINQIKRIHLSYYERNKMIKICEGFEESRAKNEYGQALLSETYILQLFIFLNRWFMEKENVSSSDNIMPQVISDVMAYIQDNLDAELTLEKLSKEFFFQSRYLSNMFKKYTGLTLRTYIMDCRISMAKRLLSEGCNVSETCYRSGFNDYANFLRSFKNYVGMSPGKYGKQERKLKQRMGG